MLAFAANEWTCGDGVSCMQTVEATLGFTDHVGPQSEAIPSAASPSPSASSPALSNSGPFPPPVSYAPNEFDMTMCTADIAEWTKRGACEKNLLVFSEDSSLSGNLVMRNDVSTLYAEADGSDAGVKLREKFTNMRDKKAFVRSATAEVVSELAEIKAMIEEVKAKQEVYLTPPLPPPMPAVAARASSTRRRRRPAEAARQTSPGRCGTISRASPGGRQRCAARGSRRWKTTSSRRWWRRRREGKTNARERGREVRCTARGE